MRRVKTLLDSNILTRMAQPVHPQHVVALDSVARLVQQGDQICIVPQNLYEFWAVATRPPGENGLGMTVSEAQNELVRLRGMFLLLRDERGVLRCWERLVYAHEVKGKTSHDARLVAALARHGLTQLLTFNASHFARFAGITVLTPAGVLASSE
jgi:predicted nucleic acid-binding protein